MDIKAHYIELLNKDNVKHASVHNILTEGNFQVYIIKVGTLEKCDIFLRKIIIKNMLNNKIEI